MGVGQHREFALALTRGRVQADAEVADSLYRRACGYEHEAVKIFKNKGEDPVLVPYIERYPPDTPAAIAFLSRRQPGWQQTERIDMNVRGSLTHKLDQMTLDERGALAIDLAARIRQRLADAGLDENGDPIVVIENEPADGESGDK
jgi:hypothetical protein